MFCPNCGNNCGDAKFCSNCGTALKAGPVHSVKMEEGNFDFPYGSYRGFVSSLTLYDTYLEITRRPMLKKFTTKIPYSQLVAVQFHRQVDIKNNSAYLIVRGEENKHIPIPNEAELWNEKTMIMTTPVTDVLFFHIFSALKAVVPSTVEFSRVAPAENMVTDIKVSEEILDALFVKYAPFREDAVEALCTRTGMKRKIAVIVIDCAFDARQTAIYEANPREAIRDLNIVVDKLKKDHKEAVEELREYQKEQRHIHQMANAIGRQLDK